MDVFNAHPLKLRTSRLQQILLSRNIQGVIVAPIQTNYPNAVTTIDLDWSIFCSVTFGYSLRSPEINRVTTDHYHDIYEAMLKLHELGFKKPGLFLSRVNNARIFRLWEAGYLVGMRAIFKRQPLPAALFDKDKNKTTALVNWYNEVEPDVIIAQDYGLEKKLIPVPEKTDLCTKLTTRLWISCHATSNTTKGE